MPEIVYFEEGFWKLLIEPLISAVLLELVNVIVSLFEDAIEQPAL